MTTPIWITTAGLLTTATELVFTSTSILATGTNIKYSIISGGLPPGLEFSQLGVISGSPDAVFDTTRSEFTVRARNFPYYADQSFYIDVEGPNVPNWITPSGYLDVGYNRELYAIDKQWTSIRVVAESGDLPPSISLSYSLSNGILPPGLTLSTDGIISGFVNDEFTESVPVIYEFTVTVSDGIRTADQIFKIAVIHPDMLRADSELFDWVYDVFTADNMYASIGYLQPLQFLDGTDLGTIIPSTNLVSIPVTAYDADPTRGPVTYKIVSGYLPEGLSLNSSTGIIKGYAQRTFEYTENYQITVAATKTDVVSSATVVTNNTFDLKLQGRIESPLMWITSANLGSIEKGTVSELAVLAKEFNSSTGIKYSLVSGELPGGLTLKYDGTLVGRISYDTDTTNYTFTVRATNQFKSRTIDRTFTLTITWSDNTRYSDIYFRPFLAIDKRIAYNDFITNEDIFVPSVMYRYNDLNFGVQRNIKMVLEFGLEQLYQEEYYYSLMENFYKKRFTLGTVKSAVGLDSAGTHVYDVIYVEVIDELVNNAGTSVNSIVMYPWTQNEVYYPASIENMRTQLKSTTLIDYSKIKVKDSLQPKFITAPGSTYISVVPLCYTLPGKSAAIIRKIKNSGFKFNTVDFEIDRIVVANTLDNTGDKYLRFDRQAFGDLVDTDSYIQGPEGWIRLDDDDDQPLLRE
jgi:hypothetical protein